MAEGFELLKKGLRVNTEQEGLLIRAGWITVVTGHIAWVCGWLAFLGIASPFVQAGDIQKQMSALSAKQDKTDAKVDNLDSLLRLQLAQSKAAEIRYVVSKLCSRPEAADRDRLLSERDRLGREYELISGYRYVEPSCEQLH